MSSTRHFSPEQIDEAKAALKKAALLHFAGLFGPELVGVEVSNGDACRYILEQEQGIELDIESYMA